MVKRKHPSVNSTIVPAHTTVSPPAQPNKSLIDGLACLQVLAMNGEPIGMRDLARKMHLEPTRAHRLLKTLAYIGIAQQNEEGKYSPGPGMHVLAAQSLFGSGLFRKALGPLEGLHTRWKDCTVAMGVLWRLNVCYLYHAAARLPITDALGRVGLKEVTGSSIGMAVLSSNSDGYIRALFEVGPIEGTTAEELLQSIHTTRAQGYARIPVQRFDEWSIGVRVKSAANAGIALSGHFSAEDEKRVVEDLHRTADQIG